MSAQRSAPDSLRRIRAAVAGMGQGPIQEAAVERHLHPLFTRALAAPGVYLANHSLGRPPDTMAADVAEALDHWYRGRGGAWWPWLDELERYRRALAELLRLPRADAIVPRASAGQGLRAVLNGLPAEAVVLTSDGEFDSLDFILRVYAEQGRIRLVRTAADADGRFDVAGLERRIDRSVDLVVVSMVMFRSGQLLTGLERLADACHAHGAWLLVDTYHAAGVLPVDLSAMDADFAVGGCYKYLRGGPGSGWLYVHPRLLDDGFRTLDIGWFAKADRFAFEREERPSLAPGGDALLESTPAVLPWYQARSGLAFTLAVGVDRLRAYNLRQQALLTEMLAQSGVEVAGDAQGRGAFVTLPHPDAGSLVEDLREQGVITDARAGLLRICPDVLTTGAELTQAVEALGRALARHRRRPPR